MDKILKYETAILSFLNEYAQIIPANLKKTENRVIADKTNHHYQLLRLGWQNDEHIFQTIFHFDIIDDKIWVQQNRTDLPLDEEFKYLGIAPEDIVWGVVHPNYRTVLSD
jgi:XisI protein